MPTLDLALLSLLVATFVPALALVFAVKIDQRRRKQIEKPPQTDKFLRPPGYSLSLRLDENSDQMLNDLAASCVLSGIAVR